MRSKWIAVLLMILILASACISAGAEEAAPKDQPAQQITIPVIIQPNEVRSYKVSAGIKGCIGITDSAQMVVDALSTMRVQHKYGVREKDGLLLLDIAASDVQVTVNGEKVLASSDQFPKLTLLLDRSWKVDKMFGGERATAEEVPGLNYSSMILLFFVPDADKPHAIGDSWISKVKSPGKSSEVTIKSTIKSVTEADGSKVVAVHQDFSWGEQKLDAGRTVNSTAVVDSTFDLASGKLLKSTAECQLPFSDPSQTKVENRSYKATAKIDVSLEK